MLKINKTKTIFLAMLSAVSALLALLIFIFLPTSEIANGIQYSGKDAILVLAVSPIASIISSASFIYCAIMNYNNWCKYLSEHIAIGAIAGLTLVGIYNIAVYLKYFITQFSLGFVAPYDGTVYEYLAFISAIVVIIKFILAILTVIAVKRIK